MRARRLVGVLVPVLGLVLAGAAMPVGARAAAPSISASPAYVLAPAGGVGTTTITWSTGDGAGADVDVSCNGSAYKLFASGASGSQSAPWIGPGSTCAFDLIRGSTLLGQAIVDGVQAGTVTASPATLAVPSGGLGDTTVSWWTADGSDAQVWVSVNGSPQKLMAEGPWGTATPGWIQAGTTVFNLYEGTAHSELLDSVTVTASTPATTTVAPPAPSSPAGGAPSSSPAAVTAELLFTWRWNARSTVLRRATIRGLPSRARVTVRCRGRGCFRGVLSARGRRVVGRLLAGLAGRRFAPGDRLLVSVSAPGLVPERAEVTIRRGKLPLGRLL